MTIDLEAGEFDFVGDLSATDPMNPGNAPSLGGLGFSTPCPETCVPDLNCDTGLAGVCSLGITICPNPFGDSICEQTVFPSAEVCDGFDNDCNEAVDEELDQPTICGVGECFAEGVIACVDGETQPDSCLPGDPSAEVCDGLDNDCDEIFDEDLAVETVCGVGECGATGEIVCVEGELQPDTCVAGAPSAEICDGLNNDCDEETDENLDIATICGVGECLAEGVIACEGGEFGEDTCLAGDPSAEICDGLDNDCDEAFDEDLDVATICGVGECEATGLIVCENGEILSDSCVPGDPSAEVCDGLDNDCDELADENLDEPTMCGVGECLAVGVIGCVDGELQGDTCLPGDPSAEVCDGLDNDCDVEFDEGLDIATFCGVGDCEAEGVIGCIEGELQPDTCNPGEPLAELCDDRDNNCDGTIDDGFALNEFCVEGEGQCLSEGVTVCAAGGEATECDAPQQEGTPKICDGIDNDCDGIVDVIDQPNMCVATNFNDWGEDVELLGDLIFVGPSSTESRSSGEKAIWRCRLGPSIRKSA